MTTKTDMEMLVDVLDIHTKTIQTNLEFIEKLFEHIDSLVDRVAVLETNALTANNG